MQHYKKISIVQAPREAVFAWHQSEDAITSLIPPWENVGVQRAPSSFEEGSCAVLRLYFPLFHLDWVAQHSDYIPNEQFVDTQISGPFAFWRHTHRFRDAGPNQCEMEDDIVYELPGGQLGQMVAGWFVRRKLERMFNYRHQVVQSQFVKVSGQHDLSSPLHSSALPQGEMA